MKTATPTNAVNIIDLETAVKDLDSDLGKNINAQLLHKTTGMQIMLIGLDAKAELKRHSASGPISLQIIKGSISFRTDDTSYDLTNGQLLSLEANEPHSVYAYERSIFIVTKSIPE